MSPPPPITFDRLSGIVSHNAWGEITIVRAFAENWDRELFGLEMPEWRNGVVNILEGMYHANPRGRLVVADMGCAAGAYARHMLMRDIAFEYHGYEHNEHVLAQTCRRWEFLPHEYVKFHLLDVRIMPWPLADKSFDAVLWDGTLRVCDEPAATLAESARICRGAIILARTPLGQDYRRSTVSTYGMQKPSVYWHFDEATIRSMAQTNGLQATMRFGADDLHVLSRGQLPQTTSLKPSVRWSRAFHEAYVRERVARLFEKHDGPWVIFGAGAHSRWLCALLPEEARQRIICLVDENALAGHSINGLPVRRPEELPGALTFHVLVSSDSIEGLLWDRALVLFPKAAGVHRLYAELPPGPYDKATI